MEEKKTFDYQLLGRVIGLAKAYKSIFIICGLLAIALAPVVIMRPYLVQVMVDDYIFQSDIPGLTKMVYVFIGVLFLNGLLRYFFIFSTSWLGQSIIRDLRVRVFNHITKLRLTYFDTTPIGTSTTRTINDIETINTVFSSGMITIISDILTLFAVLGIMFVTSWQLTLICLVTMPFLMVATYIFKGKVKASYQIVRNKISSLNAFLQERISGMRIVQIFNAEEQEMRKFDEINQSYRNAWVDSILYYAIFFPVVEIISAVSLGLMVWWGTQGVISSSISLGDLIAFPIYVNMLFRPLRMLADKFNQLQMGLVAAERVFDVLDNEDFIPNEGTFAPKKLAGNVAFENVTFAYIEEDYVLKNVNFNINKGETLAIVGSTGSGKSTIINLLSRFYEINDGAIKIDGKDIRDYELYALRKQIAVVLQDVFLFSGSVFENITLRDERFSREEVIDAAKLIGAHEFIMKLPGGYDYQVMERGATLSMGQRQLISFVRALVFDPEILILDEATSSIDPETEGVIQYAIEKLIDKRTSVIIAHRLSTIRHADNIMVLDRGEVKEFGPHADLLEIDGGYYKNLHDMQFLETVA